MCICMMPVGRDGILGRGDGVTLQEIGRTSANSCSAKTSVIVDQVSGLALLETCSWVRHSCSVPHSTVDPMFNIQIEFERKRHHICIGPAAKLHEGPTLRFPLCPGPGVRAPEIVCTNRLFSAARAHAVQAPEIYKISSFWPEAQLAHAGQKFRQKFDHAVPQLSPLLQVTIASQYLFKASISSPISKNSRFLKIGFHYSRYIAQNPRKPFYSTMSEITHPTIKGS